LTVCLLYLLLRPQAHRSLRRCSGSIRCSTRCTRLGSTLTING